jgi:hypothetical protein
MGVEYPCRRSGPAGLLPSTSPDHSVGPLSPTPSVVVGGRHPGTDMVPHERPCRPGRKGVLASLGVNAAVIAFALRILS